MFQVLVQKQTILFSTVVVDVKYLMGRPSPPLLCPGSRDTKTMSTSQAMTSLSSPEAVYCWKEQEKLKKKTKKKEKTQER